MNLSELNESQLEAVMWSGGPLLVLAGPGSGKTRVLTFRIARLIEESVGQHFRILALTFTNKAAKEMRDRVESLVPESTHRVRLTTFHSFCAELLQQHGNHLSYRPDFQILGTDGDRIALLDDALRIIESQHPGRYPEHFKAESLLPAITKWLDHCVAENDLCSLLKKAGNEHSEELTSVYQTYRMLMRETNQLDFPSLIFETLELLKSKPAIIKNYRKIYKHILVDEFQDTNYPQYRILHHLITPNPETLFVVADDDQIIYQWTGASPKRIDSLRNDFGIQELQLPENYRCPKAVIDRANLLIQHNLSRSASKLPLQAHKQDDPDGAIRCKGFSNVSQEASAVAKDIASRPKDQISRCAVLARTRKLLEVVGKELQELGIEVYYAARKNEFSSAPMIMLHSILRLAGSATDKQSIARLSKAFFQLEGVKIDVSSTIARSSADGEDYLRAWLAELEGRLDSIPEETRLLLKQGIKPLLVSLDYRSFEKTFFEWVEGKESDKSGEASVFDEYSEEEAVWKELTEDVRRKFGEESVGLHQMLREIDMNSKTPSRSEDAVPCFTIHASKGMEFGHVYLVGLVEDQLPSWAAVKKGDDSPEMQEERRNCFVAITRAQDSLTISFSRQVFGWSKAPSRFLREMGYKV